MAALARLAPIGVVQAAKKHTASLIFLHGSGDTGQGVRFWLSDLLEEEFSFNHIRVIYPTAPQRPYTPFGGLPSSVWFDRKQISPFVPEDDSIDEMCKNIDALIEQEVKNGIPKKRIMLGGFSMGGALAMYYGFQHGCELAGIFALSAFLNQNSKVYTHLKSQEGIKWPPLFQAHGEKDSLVRMEWGEDTSKTLTSLGLTCQFHKYSNIVHEMCEEELILLQKWINSIVPEN